MKVKLHLLITQSNGVHFTKQNTVFYCKKNTLKSYKVVALFYSVGIML